MFIIGGLLLVIAAAVGLRSPARSDQPPRRGHLSGSELWQEKSGRHPSRMTGRRLASPLQSPKEPTPWPPSPLCIQAAGVWGPSPTTRVAPLPAKVVTADAQQRPPPPATHSYHRV